MAKKVKIEKDKEYCIEPINGEYYGDCKFEFGIHKIIDVDEEGYFKVNSEDRELNDIRWDSEGFKITEK